MVHYIDFFNWFCLLDDDIIYVGTFSVDEINVGVGNVSIDVKDEPDAAGIAVDVGAAAAINVDTAIKIESDIKAEINIE